jgi:hypothetical protein
MAKISSTTLGLSHTFRNPISLSYFYAQIKAISFPLSIREEEFNKLYQRSMTLEEQNTKECAGEV